MRNHLIIPDNQISPGRPIQYGRWISKLIMERRPEVIVFLGDLWDFPSLSSYDVGNLAAEGKRLYLDIKSGWQFLDLIYDPLKKEQKRQKKNKHKQYLPEVHFCIGNHEERLLRFVEKTPTLEGFLTLKDLKLENYGIIVHNYLEIFNVDGVNYSHFFPRNAKGTVGMNVKAGAPSARIQAVRYHQSCTAGHAPGLDYDCTQVRGDGSRIHSLIAGSCYLHDESYRTPQGNHDWRGVVYKHNVENGEYDPEFISLKRLEKL